MVGVRLNAFTGEILWYTLDFSPSSGSPSAAYAVMKAASSNAPLRPRPSIPSSRHTAAA